MSPDAVADAVAERAVRLIVRSVEAARGRLAGHRAELAAAEADPAGADVELCRLRVAYLASSVAGAERAAARTRADVRRRVLNLVGAP